MSGQPPRRREVASVREAGDNIVGEEELGSWSTEELCGMESAVDKRRMVEQIAKERRGILAIHTR